MHPLHKRVLEAEKLGVRAEKRTRSCERESYVFLIVNAAAAQDNALVAWMLDNHYAHRTLYNIQLHFHAESSDSAKQRAYAQAVYRFLLPFIPTLEWEQRQ